MEEKVFHRFSTREELEKRMDKGNLASIAKPLLDEITTEIIEQCKTEFEKLPIKIYQNSDNNEIFVLQLKMRVAKEMQIAIERRISDGELAKSELTEGIRHGL